MRRNSNPHNSKGQAQPPKSRPVGGHRPAVTARGRAIAEEARRRRAEGRF